MTPEIFKNVNKMMFLHFLDFTAIPCLAIASGIPQYVERNLKNPLKFSQISIKNVFTIKMNIEFRSRSVDDSVVQFVFRRPSSRSSCEKEEKT